MNFAELIWVSPVTTQIVPGCAEEGSIADVSILPNSSLVVSPISTGSNPFCQILNWTFVLTGNPLPTTSRLVPGIPQAGAMAMIVSTTDSASGIRMICPVYKLSGSEISGLILRIASTVVPHRSAIPSIVSPGKTI